MYVEKTKPYETWYILPYLKVIIFFYMSTMVATALCVQYACVYCFGGSIRDKCQGLKLERGTKDDTAI